MRLAVLFLLAVALAGCESGTGGDATATHGVPAGAAPSAIRASAERTVAAWRAEVARQGRTGPGTRFPSPPEATLRRRLAVVSDQYGLRVVRVEVLHPRQDAPLVVLQGRGKRRIVDAVPLILGAIDPQTDRGSAYEAFLLEARDEAGVPFVVTFNYWRGRKGGSDQGGGQWASSPDLYPYRHG